MKDRLYRYRGFTEYSVLAFLLDDFFLSVPEKFNDPYDVSFVFNEGVVRDYIESFLDEKTKSTIDILLSSETGFFKSNTKDNFFDFVLSQLMFSVRRGCAIACLSSSMSDEVMWAHYGESGKGFVIEYDYGILTERVDFSKDNVYNNFVETQSIPRLRVPDVTLEEIRKDLDNYGIGDVEYENELNDFTSVVLDMCDFMKFVLTQEESFDFSEFESAKELYKFFLKKAVTHKRNPVGGLKQLRSLYYRKLKKWKYEEEIRVVLPNKMDHGKLGEFDFIKITKVPAKAVYAGEYISSYNLMLLKSLCEEKNIPLFKMVSNYSKNPPVLEAINIEKLILKENLHHS